MTEKEFEKWMKDLKEEAIESCGDNYCAFMVGYLEGTLFDLVVNKGAKLIPIKEEK